MSSSSESETESMEETLDAVERGNALKEEGNTAFKNQDYDVAIDRYEEAIALLPEVAALRTNLAAANLALNRFAQALAAAEGAIRLEPTNPKALLRQAKAEFALGKKNRFLRSLRALTDLGRVKEVAELEEGAKKVDDLIEKGNAALRAGDVSRALDFAESALEHAPRDPRAAVIKCNALIDARQAGFAAKLAGEFLRDDGNCVPLLAVRARALAENGTLDQAAKHAQKALQLDPDNKGCMKLFKALRGVEKAKADGAACVGRRAFAEAIEAYTAALDKCDDVAAQCQGTRSVPPALRELRAPLYANRGVCRLESREYDQAIADCSAALDADEKYLKARLRRAKAYTALGKHKEAVYDYEKALQESPTSDIQRLLRAAKAALKRAGRKDYYKILGVLPSATESEIKKGYRKAALRCHPDKAAESEREEAELRFKDVNEAYGVLSDPDKRSKFDSGMDLEEIEQGGMGGMHGHDMGDIFAQMFAGGGGFGGGGSPFGGGGGFHHQGGRRRQHHW